MSESDLLRFLDKVDQLQQLVRSLDCDSRRRQALSACSDHNQVVALARDWGFDIGRRWGETRSLTLMHMLHMHGSPLKLDHW